VTCINSYYEFGSWNAEGGIEKNGEVGIEKNAEGGNENAECGEQEL